MGLTRQELYEKIKASSKDAYILSEMQRLGFWSDEQPQATRSLIQRKVELQQEINQLSAQIKDPEALLKQIHKQRMAEALAKRQQTKVQREVKRYHKALAWHQRKQESLHTLGDAAHFGKNRQATQAQRLQDLQLPVLENALALSEQAGISLNELRFLTYSRRVSQISHYQRFEMPKKTGGSRLISAPMPRLKRLQYWVLDQILSPLPTSIAAHGFVKQRNILSNAQPHLGQHVLINLDLKDFFPSITYPRVKGLFVSLGYGTEIATLLALLCTEAVAQEVTLDGQRYFITAPQRRLPQGAPTSPAISNHICQHLDKRLAGLAHKWGFVYTRYADDLSFSADQSAKGQYVGALLKGIASIVASEGFELHPTKTRVMRKGARQEVTGLIVNQQADLPAEQQQARVPAQQLKRFRALLFQLQKDGLGSQTWQGASAQQPDFLERLTGFAHFVNMVQPEKGARFLAQINEIRQDLKQPAAAEQAQALKASVAKAQFRQRSAQGQLPLPHQRRAIVPPTPRLEDLIQHREVLTAVKEQIEEQLNNRPLSESRFPAQQGEQA